MYFRFHLITLWHQRHASCLCGWFVMWSTEEKVSEQIRRHRMETMGRPLVDYDVSPRGVVG